MKKVYVGVIFAVSLVLGMGSGAHAVYPPRIPVVAVSAINVDGQARILVSVSGAKPGETVSIEIDGGVYEVVVGADGTASTSIPVPSKPGLYTLTAIFGSNGMVVEVTIEVLADGGWIEHPGGGSSGGNNARPGPVSARPTGSLPSTGAGAIPFLLSSGLTVLLGGLLLVGVARRRCAR